MVVFSAFSLVIDLAGQKAFTERTERHEADAKFFKRRQNLLLRLAPPQRIFALQSGDRLHGVNRLYNNKPAFS